MSPPDTNLEKQKRRHRWPLVGIVLAAGAGVLLLLVNATQTVEDTDPPEGAETQIDGRTGDVAEE